ncbi:hypothetical protein J1N10_18565 [Carboxylicivirga sp. A043]|uniref:hypothetical protein n=1 Tax=Carboxylicivirga litoralis TaxID=2816963 RepID=UPI0021CB8C50|nr:hypothetical protein [Carboxylicivirga sp. A043]MCU4157984.1 hypothetical protein [Carboxylicivirga sp. A043]
MKNIMLIVILLLAIIQNSNCQEILNEKSISKLEFIKSEYKYSEKNPLFFSIHKKGALYSDHLTLYDRAGDGIGLWVGKFKNRPSNYSELSSTEQREIRKNEAISEYYIKNFIDILNAIKKFELWKEQTSKIDFSFKKTIPIEPFNAIQITPFTPNHCFGFNFLYLKESDSKYLQLITMNGRYTKADKTTKTYSILLDEQDAVNLAAALTKVVESLRDNGEKKNKVNEVFK